MNKYRAKPTEFQGVRFASKLEAEFAQTLETLRYAHSDNVRVVWWERQIPFQLPWGTKHTVDFVVGKADGSWCLVEVKGMETREARERRRALEWFLGFPITVWP